MALTQCQARAIYKHAVEHCACENNIVPAKEALDKCDLELFERICRGNIVWLLRKQSPYVWSAGVCVEFHTDTYLEYFKDSEQWLQGPQHVFNAEKDKLITVKYFLNDNFVMSINFINNIPVSLEDKYYNKIEMEPNNTLRLRTPLHHKQPYKVIQNGSKPPAGEKDLRTRGL